MKYLFFILCLLVLIYSCRDEEKEIKIDTIASANVQSKLESKPYKNPVIIFGSSFGHFFQTLYLQNKFDEMLLFTSHYSRLNNGDKAISGFYKNKFQFDFELGKLIAIETESDKTNLIYKANIMATKRKIVLPITIENDSVKYILTNLNTQW